MWKAALRFTVLGIFLLVASTEMPYGESAQAYGGVLCSYTNCYTTMMSCSGFYLMEDEQSCDYNPYNPSATNNYRFTCYGPSGEPSFIAFCAY